MHIRPRLLAPLALALAATATAVLPHVARAGEPIVVQAGDTLSELAERHGVEPGALAAANRLADPNRIYIGQRLQLPGSVSQVVETTRATGADSHVVRAGETLTRIARKHGVTVAAIASANRLANPNRIYVGQRLTIPRSTPPASTPPPASPPAETAPAGVHVVVSGDNLTRIGRRYGASPGAIAAANGLANPNRIMPGQRLVIPGAGVPPSPPPAAQSPSSGEMPAQMAALVARRDAVRVVITEEATRYGVPVSLALAVGWQESGWRQEAVSSAGARGVMQLMPDTARWVAETMLREPVAIDDLRFNVRAGVRLLAHYLDRYDGNRELVLAAYYQGQAGTDRHGVYPVSRGYVASVLRLERLFGG